VQTDKNIGLAIIANELLDSLSVPHLNDTSVYTKLNSNPLQNGIRDIKTILNALYTNKELNIPIQKLMVSNPKLGKFRILVKLHKEKFGIRPIINNTGHITSQLCKLIDLLIQPILRNTSTYLKDSQHLLQKCNDLVIEESNVHLYSMDFESLYTNIIKEDAVNLITDFIKPSLNHNYLSSFAFNIILSLIFDYNYFYYKSTKNLNSYFKQIKGLSMGCICGPSVASLFVYILESKWLVIHKPIFYGRFIDDINLIVKEKIDENNFKSYFLNLNLNIIESKTINFLDLMISFDSLTKKLNFSLFVKPTNTFSYLHTNSNHPNFIFKNIPKSLFIRIRRICTKYTDYLYYTRKLIVQLLNRGYNFSKLLSLAFSIGNIDRKDLLPYKQNKYFIKPEQCFYFGSQFNKNFPELNHLVSNSFKTIVENSLILLNYKLKLYNSMSANIFSIFVHNKYNNRSFFKNTISCNSLNCITCKFVNSNDYVSINQQFFIPIQSRCTCESTHIVYIIKCKLCNEFYIGQSEKSARIRLKQHIRAIVKFKPFIRYTNEVGYHFNLKGHNYLRDFEFFIFKDKIKKKKYRLSVENDIIHIVNNFNKKIMNKIIPSIYKLNTLSFL
jgi:predicted GIY-YIG superfamily endonuclease